MPEWPANCLVVPRYRRGRTSSVAVIGQPSIQPRLPNRERPSYGSVLTKAMSMVTVAIELGVPAELGQSHARTGLPIGRRSNGGSMLWTRFADRMRSSCAALHAIWDSWHNDQPLATFAAMIAHLSAAPREGPNTRRDLLSRRYWPTGDRVTAEVMQMVRCSLPAMAPPPERYRRELTIHHPIQNSRGIRRPDSRRRAVRSQVALTGLDRTLGLLRVAAAVSRRSPEWRLDSGIPRRARHSLGRLRRAPRPGCLRSCLDTFDDRKASEPLNTSPFSRGPHCWLGAQLARWRRGSYIVDIFSLRRPVSTLLTEQLPLHPSPIVRGYTELPVRLTPRQDDVRAHR